MTADKAGEGVAFLLFRLMLLGASDSAVPVSLMAIRGCVGVSN